MVAVRVCGCMRMEFSGCMIMSFSPAVMLSCDEVKLRVYVEGMHIFT